MATMLLCVIVVNAQTVRTHEIENDGFEWYFIEKDGKKGAEDKYGNTILPVIFSLIRYSKGWFWVRKEEAESEAVYTREGNCFIPFSRGYDISGFMEVEGKTGYFYVWRIYNGKAYEGACDMTGKEIIPTKYQGVHYENNRFEVHTENGNDITLDLNLDSEGIAYSPSSKSTYTVRNSHNPSGYKNNTFYDYSEVPYGLQPNVAADAAAKTIMNNIISNMWNNVGESQKIIENMAKDVWKNGVPATPVQTGGGGSTGGGSVGGSSRSSSSGHRCNLCNGTGRKVRESWSGDKTSTKWCNECNKRVGMGHSHTKCDLCRGDGWCD